MCIYTKLMDFKQFLSHALVQDKEGDLSYNYHSTHSKHFKQITFISRSWGIVLRSPDEYTA